MEQPSARPPGDASAVDNDAIRSVPAELLTQAQLLAAIWERAADALVFSDRDGIVLAANPAYYRLYDFTPEQVLGHSFAIIFPPEQREWAREQYRQVFASPADGAIVQSTVRRRDGSERVVETQVDFVSRDGARIAMLSTIRDISERRRIELNNEFLANISLELARLTSIDAAMETLGPRIAAYFNVAYLMLAQLDEAASEAIITHAWQRDDVPAIAGTFRLGDYLTEDFRSAVRAGEVHSVGNITNNMRTTGDAFRAHRIVSLVTVPLVRDGQSRFILALADTRPREWRGDEVEVLRELTTRVWTRLERLRAEAALRASEERLRVLVESVHDYAIFTLDPDGKVTSWNEGARRLKGYTAAEVLGRPVEQFYTAEDVAMGTPARERATALREGRSEQETWRVRKDGSRFWGNEIMTPLYAADGTHLGFTKITRDVTARKEADEAMARALAAEQAARIAAEQAASLKDDFLATVSHELRTPITAMLGYAYLLSARTGDPAYVARAAEKLAQSAKTQAQLVEDLLDMSRLFSGTLRLALEPVDLAQVVVAAVDTLRPAIENRGMQLRLSLSRSDSRVAGDAQRLQQVVWNIISNAIKFTPDGGRIDVELQRLDRQTVQLLVRDTGIGIDQQFLPHVFDRFRQADSSSTRAAGGLGVGLALVRQLVELHGGTVEIHSAGTNRGTIVRVTLPSVERTPAPEPPGAALPQREDCPPELMGLRVLLVDDQPDILDLLDQTLSACGAEVRAHTSAPAALAELRAWRPDVLISDIAMPEHDGYWLIARVRELPQAEGGATPAIALTAYVRVDDRMRVLYAGFQLFVPKPVEPQELRESVVRLISMEAPGDVTGA